MNFYKFTPEQSSILCQKYLSGSSLCELSRDLGVSRDVINRILGENNVPIRHFYEQMQINRKYPLNQNFFDVIDSHDKAYFLGFLYADGYNQENSYNVSLTQKEKDSYLLTYLGNLIFFKERKLLKAYHDGNVYFHLFINSKIVSKRLKELGCFQKKSLTLQFPSLDQVPNQFINSFLRGYFDGDGCISTFTDKHGFTSCTIYFLSSKDFTFALKKVLEDNLSVHNLAIKSCQGCFRLSVANAHSIESIYHFLYKDSKFSNARKYQRFINFLNGYKHLNVTEYLKSFIETNQIPTIY